MIADRQQSFVKDSSPGKPKQQWPVFALLAETEIEADFDPRSAKIHEKVSI